MTSGDARDGLLVGLDSYLSRGEDLLPTKEGVWCENTLIAARLLAK
jgi:hypothetical protein